jgi:putative tryptophan/tyrosine transport system substrate-binding protein
MCVLAIACSVFAAPLTAEAQEPRIPRIGVLSPGGTRFFLIDAFRQGLHDFGYVEGKNILIDYRYADWKLDRLPGLAEELLRLRPDVILTHTTPGVLAARQATKTIPIVVGPAGGLVEQGFVASLARPGGNITGLTLIDNELEPKRLQILKEAVQKVSRVAILVNPANPAWNHYPESFRPAAHDLGLRLQRVEARDPTEFAVALTAAFKDRADGLLVVSDAMFSVNQSKITELAGKRRLPSISGRRGFALDGGLIQYGPSNSDMARRAATFVDKILKGAAPGDLPVEQPAKFELVINLKAAKALGLAIPQSILVRADEVIR